MKNSKKAGLRAAVVLATATSVTLTSVNATASGAPALAPEALKVQAASAAVPPVADLNQLMTIQVNVGGQIVPVPAILGGLLAAIGAAGIGLGLAFGKGSGSSKGGGAAAVETTTKTCLLYTSDAADE